MYPLILIFCNIPGTVYRVLRIIYGESFSPNDDHAVFLAAVTCSQGILNSAVYGTTPQVVDEWKRYCLRLLRIGCCGQQSAVSTNNESARSGIIRHGDFSGSDSEDEDGEADVNSWIHSLQSLRMFSFFRGGSIVAPSSELTGPSDS